VTGEEEGRDRMPEAPISPEGIGMLVAFLDTRRMEQRRSQALHRLAALRATKGFADLPEDLRTRIRELIEESEQPSD
jgi:hypothetical protein